jgi:hypothetical protein
MKLSKVEMAHIMRELKLELLSLQKNCLKKIILQQPFETVSLKNWNLTFYLVGLTRGPAAPKLFP